MGSGEYKFKYTVKNGRLEQVIITEYDDSEAIPSEKIVYSKWQKVSHVRNCDATGYPLPPLLGWEYRIEGPF